MRPWYKHGAPLPLDRLLCLATKSPAILSGADRAIGSRNRNRKYPLAGSHLLERGDIRLLQFVPASDGLIGGFLQLIEALVGSVRGGTISTLAKDHAQESPLSVEPWPIRERVLVGTDFEIYKRLAHGNQFCDEAIG